MMTMTTTKMMMIIFNDAIADIDPLLLTKEMATLIGRWVMLTVY